MKLDVLAFSAHPDDIELACGGTIAKLVKQGRKVGIVDLTEGELGTRGTREIRAQEAADAARILGVHLREGLGIPDGNIENSAENRLKVIRSIRKHRPDVLLFPFHTDRHPDHEHAHVLCREAWFYSGLEKIETLEERTKQPPHRPRNYYNYMQWFEFIPSFVVDITDEYEQRVAAVVAFKSQLYNPSSNEPMTALSTPEFLEMLRTRFEYYGDRIGRKYGEAFHSPSPIAISDLFSL
ncbi:MAG: Bacillithiol biosynthesis deacetylase BshB1 [Bacteroidetes bacterium]|nr:Bacillithiol biosynthesis deacetylase BshB1 [Bacteroidota bacterium]